ncbi:MAG: aldolase/citrate lyase family protein [Pseudomonadota bacterium]
MSLPETKLRRIWTEDRCALNGWLAIPSTLSVEAMARAGWDSITIDMQHGTADYAAMLAMLPVIEQAGLTPMVRAPWNEPSIVMRALDAGVMGVICPMIETADDARLFVKSCLYPPRGARSFGPIRARLVHGDTYAAEANDRVLPIAMIETRAALDNLDEIAAVDGLAALYIGPSDLASALGYKPAFDRREPELVTAIERIRDAATKNGIAACIHCGTPEYAMEMAGKGFRLVTVGSDARFIEAGAKATVAAFRGA